MHISIVNLSKHFGNCEQKNGNKSNVHMFSYLNNPLAKLKIFLTVFY